MIDYSSILRLWQVTSNGHSVPISWEHLKDLLSQQIPNFSGQDLINELLARQLIALNMYGEYFLTAEGLKLRGNTPPPQTTPNQSMGNTPPQTPPNQNIGKEWLQFRKLLNYYIDCVHFQEKKQDYLFPEKLNKEYFVPALPTNWLKELGNESECQIPVRQIFRIAKQHLEVRNDEDEEIYIGYPVSAFCAPASGKTCYSAVGLIPVDLVKFDIKTITIKLRLNEAEINQQWLDFAYTPDKRNDFINSILNRHSNDDFRGMIDLKSAMELLECTPDPNSLDPTLPILKRGEKCRLCNTPVLFVGQPLKYSKTLKKELKYIRDKVDDAELDSTALAYLFRNPPLESPSIDSKFMPLQFIDSNIEQMAAVEDALNTPSTKITGPPGTGKSQVAVNIIANLIYNDRSVLFTSKNHRAVLAIAERSMKLLENTQLNLVQFCTNEDNSTRNAWYDQKLDTLRTNVSTMQDSLDPDAVRETMSAIYTWQDVEKTYGDRQQVLNAYAKCQGDREKAWQRMQRILPNLKENEVSKEHLQRFCHAVRQLATPVPYSFRHLFKWLYWRFFGEKQHRLGMEYLQQKYPDFRRSEPSIEGLKRRMQELKRYFDEYCEAGKKLAVLQTQAKALPDIQEGCRHLANCHAQIRQHLKNAFVYKRFEKLKELVEEPKIVQDLENSFSVLRGAKSPYFFQRANQTIFQNAEKGFRLFSKYYPAWATTLLSLTKASPCISKLFDTVIIDEASQCDIPPIIPALFRARHAVLIGDPNQFPPVRTLVPLRNDFLKARNGITEVEDQRFDYLNHSAYDLSSQVPVLLKEHFRCAEDIANFFNEEYYNNELRIRSEERPMNFPTCMGYKQAVEWIDVPNSLEGEVREAKRHYKLLKDNNYSGTVGIIAPFKEYKDKLREALYPLTGKNNEFINTVNGFQGGERDVIILVLGYNDQLTKGQVWYAEAKEHSYIYNVAVSRAKASLIIIGDKAKCAKSSVSALRKLATLPLPKKSQKQKDFESIWEERLFNALQQAGIVCDPQYPCMGRWLDLAVITENTKIDIEVDGAKYHLTNEGKRKMDDYYRDLQVASAGWLVKRFWVHDLQNNMDQCVQEVQNMLK